MGKEKEIKLPSLVSSEEISLTYVLTLVVDHVKHLPYEESASTYVSKYIYDGNWGIVNNNS